jgi:hypothetical protein
MRAYSLTRGMSIVRTNVVPVQSAICAEALLLASLSTLSHAAGALSKSDVCAAFVIQEVVARDASGKFESN